MSELGIPGTDLLEDRFEHLGLLLYDLSQLLKLRVGTQEIQAIVAETTGPGGGSSTTSATAILTGLRSCLKQVYRGISLGGSSCRACVTTSLGWRRGRTTRLLLLLLLGAFWNALPRSVSNN